MDTLTSTASLTEFTPPAAPNVAPARRELSQKEESDILRRFSSDTPSKGEFARVLDLRNGARDLARAIVRLAPESRERATALKRLEECFMFARAAVERGPQGVTFRRGPRHDSEPTPAPGE